MASSSTRASDILAGIFVGLKSKNPDVRLQSAVDLKRYAAANDAGDDADLISRRLFELIHSQNATDNIGGLIAIDHLIDAPDSHHNLFRFYNYVKHLLPNPDPALILAASKTLGHILALGGPAFGETFMEHQGLPDAIALITSSSSSHDVAAGMSRYAGALILKELARNMPVQFTPHLQVVLETAILPPLRDARLVVRKAGAELLAVCLEIGAQRERVADTETTYLIKLLVDAQAGIKSNHPEVMHGSLLTYRELLLHAGAFMRDSFPETADSVLALRATRDATVRRLVVSMIPTLASFNTPLFKELVLHKAMAHLLSLLERLGERDYALIAIGHTTTAVGPDMRPFLETVMAHITTRLKETATAAAHPTHSTSNPPPSDALLAALALLAAAVGPTLTMLLHDHLPLLFVIGLSESLRACLGAIARAIPPLLGVIQDRLLDLLSYILSGTPYTRLGAPPQVTHSGATGTNQGYGSGWAVSAAVGSQNKELLTLALNTLGTFDFSGHILTEFAQSRALAHVEDDAPEVRRAAALACCRLFGGAPALSIFPTKSGSRMGQDPFMAGGSLNLSGLGMPTRSSVGYQTSTHSVDVLSEVLGKLLTVAIADPDPSIRNTVLGSLNEQFDRHLSQAENLRSLFIALNDEVFENRITAAALIGRMARHNPAYVMPSLRKTLIQLLTEWEYSTDPLRREESIQLLTALVINTQRLIRPYALPMFGVLLQKASTAASPVGLSASMLTCLGALASVGGEDAKPYIAQVMPALIAGLEDASLAKRETALRALGRVCSSTGYVVTPLVEYPELLPLLGRILRTDGMDRGRARAGGQAMKREVVKVLGILGAMDPYRSKKIMENEMGYDKSMVGINPIPLTSSAPITSTGTSPDDYFQIVVVSALIRVLKDPALSGYHHTVIEAIMSIFKTQGLKCVGRLPQIIPAFAAVTRISAPRLQEFHLQQLAILVGIIKQHVRNFAPEVLGLVTELWSNATLQTPIVALIEAVGTALAAELKPFLPTLLPLLLKVFSVEEQLSDKRMGTQLKVLDVFQTFGVNIEEYLHLVIPIIVATAESAHGSVALRKKAILTIDNLSRVVNFSDHASRIVHPLMRILDHGATELRVAVLDTMCSLAAQLGSDFVIFVPTINKCLIRHPITHPGYDRAVSQLLNGEHRVYDPSVSTTNDSKVSEFAVMEAAKLTVNQIHLKQAWDTAQINARQDWVDWIYRLGVELIRQSPSHALRACITLVETQSPLAKELFNGAFLSCWNELYEQYQDNLVHSLEIALISPTTPSEVSCCLLDLCEFMEREAKPLPIDHNTLGECSVKFLEYAKALHYKELEFFSTTTPAMLESLISINMRLQQHDAASGALHMAREQYDVTDTEEWYERLGHWQAALAVYDEKAKEKTNSMEIQIGRMRCLHALGEWDQLASEVDGRWSLATHEDRRLMAPMGAAAAWSLSEWDSMENYISMMPSDSTDRFFYRAILSVHRNQFPKALSQISKARELLHPELTAFGSLGHARSYNVMVRAQMLSELEEVTLLVKVSPPS